MLDSALADRFGQFLNSERIMKNVAILIFDGVEILDFCGPYEVFAVTKFADGEKAFNVFTAAEKPVVTTVSGLSINPNYHHDAAPPCDILIVPGGQGARTEQHNQHLIGWIRSRAEHAQVTASVCTGALLLARAGLLDGLEITTHHGAIELLKEVAPRSNVVEDRRYIDHGKIATSAGISAGIDLSLHLVARLLGQDRAVATATHMEYERF